MRNPLNIKATESLSETKKPSVREVISQLESAFDTFNKSVLPTSIMSMHSVHDQDGRILYASPNLAQLFGLQGEVGNETKILQQINIQDRVVVAHAIGRCCIENEPKLVEFRVASINQESKKSHRPQWLEVSLQRLETNDKEMPLVIATYNDISARKKIDCEKEHAIEDAQKESGAKTRFLGNISHELRTPLNAILGFSELLNSDISSAFSDEKKSEYIELIHSSASHLLSVLNDILDMTKIDSGMYEIISETFSLKNCLTKTTAIMSGQAQIRSINLVSDGFDDMPDIVADERAIRQILINLLSNAIKFSDDNSNVTIIAERTARNILLKVQDNGIGISDEHLGNLGKPFFQADSKYDRKYEGTGLGLSVVQGLLALHDGDMQFESKRGSGTTVTITLPIHGVAGRRVPAEDTIEQITEIHSDKNVESNDFRIARNSKFKTA